MPDDWKCDGKCAGSRLGTCTCDCEYTVKLNPDRLTGCMLMRAFPFEVKNVAGVVVQYARDRKGAVRWVQNNEGTVRNG